MTHGYGWREAPVKVAGTETYGAFRAREGVPTAESVDVTEAAIDVLDQGPTNGCVGFAWASAIWAQAVLQGVSQPALPSPLALYYWARWLTGDQKVDEGTYVHAVPSVVQALGFPQESAWPTNPDRVNDEPPFETIKAAYDQRMVRAFARIPDASKEEGIKLALSAKHPVVFGTRVDQEWSDRTTRRPWTRNGAILGGHAMTILGYDATGVIVLNSWGRAWGDAGIGVVSWEQMLRSETSDLHVLSLVPSLTAG